jgi:hypothetical protein
MNINSKMIKTYHDYEEARARLRHFHNRKAELDKEGNESEIVHNLRTIAECKEKTDRLYEEYKPIREKIEVLIKEAEGKAAARTVSPETFFKAIDEIEDYANMLGTKKDLVGTVVYVDWNAQSFPRAYKYIPVSTHFTLEKVSSGWNIVSISRDRCRTNKYALKWSETFANNMAQYTSVVR